jgi:hypothetical protein
MYNSLSIFLLSIFGSGSVTLSLCKHSVDEFPESQGQKDIFETIAILCERLGCPLVFLATSRPAENIQAAFDREPLRSLTTRLDPDADNADSDINLFLQSKFQEINKAESPSRVRVINRLPGHLKDK